MSRAFVLLAHPFLRPSMLLLLSLLGVVTSLRSSQESDSPLLLLLSSSAPAPAFHLSSTFTPRLRLSSVLRCSSSRPLPHPSLSRGPSMTCLVVTMATCILCWNPWETPLDPRGSPEGRGEGRALTQLWWSVSGRRSFPLKLQRVRTAANICCEHLLLIGFQVETSPALRSWHHLCPILLWGNEREITSIFSRSN